MEKLRTVLSGNLDAYRSIPFWSWNSHLEIPALLQQIRDMKQAGIGGFIMHARTGLQDEYLGEHWMDCIGACLQEAKRLGMEAWIYDENGWPSGFVGGKLLENEDFRARFLEYTVGAFDDSAYGVFAADPECGYRRVTSPLPGVTEYHNVYLRISPANTDILNPKVVEAFIEETHEKYYARFSDSFGKELAGFFTDEPQYYRWATPYTPCAEAYFEDIRDGLIWLFVQDQRGYAFRLKYYSVLNDLYNHNFYEKLYLWCHDHHCCLTGHSVEESALFAQMWGGAAVMPSYEFEDMPGIDALGRWNPDERSPKQVGSVAAQLGKKFILTETYGCAGHDVTPRELRSIAEAQYFQGVNRMCQHLYPYSVAGQGKVDHPPVFGPHGNWGEGFLAFNEYFARLGCIIANTREQVDVAILSPQHDVWLNYIRSRDYESVAALEESYTQLLMETLRKAGVTYHLLDETILERHGSVRGNRLQVGQMTYDTVLIPKMENLSQATYRLLEQYTGKLCVLGTLTHLDGVKAQVDLKSNLSLDDLLAGKQIPFQCPDGNSFITSREGEIGDFLFIKNLSTTEKSRVTLENAGEYRALDLESLSLRAAHQKMTLEPNGSCILLRSQAPVTETAGVRAEITDRFRVSHISENYLVLDYAELSLDGQQFTERYPIVGLMENLLRKDYRGSVMVRQRFLAEDGMALTLMLEKTKLLSADLNGSPVQFHQSPFDVNFMEAAITAVPGENVLTYSFDFWQHDGVHFALFDPMATESLRNCLYYDTTIETAYLRGDFVVGENRSLSKRKALPPVTDCLYEQGYPFFMGSLTLEGMVDYHGGSAVLELDGRFQTAEVTANGHTTQLVLDSRKDISALLQPGENVLKISVRSSLRNLLGPHHYKQAPEPFGVSPVTFTFRGQWEHGIPDGYTHTYYSVPFGICKLFLIG